MSKHTPGPWRVGNHYSEVIADMPANPPFRGMTENCVKHYGGYLVAESCAEADGRLISAAPDLLAALELALEGCEGHHPLDADIHSWQNAARAAIAKARGEP
ncbi:hypothetical protein D3C80_1752170 [compost metagenome]